MLVMLSYSHYQWLVPRQIITPGAIKTQTFDALQRPISIEVKSQTSNSQGNHTAQRLMSRLYQYDQAGNITQIKSELGTTDYGYDNLSRLTSAQPDQNLQALGLPAEQYSYDPVHNRTTSGHQPGAWSYNADNQLTQYPHLKPFSPGSQPVDTTVSYTAQGHTQKESSSQWTKDYGYSAAERLIRYQQTNPGQSQPQIEAQYRYDPFGRRIAKTITQGGTTTTTYFVYSEQGLMGEANEQGKLTRAYGFNPIAAQQGLWSTDPIWQAEVTNASLTATDTSYHYLHTDHLGTPQLGTTKEGQTSWKAAAEAFGAAGIIQSQSTIEMNLRFPGQYYDEETGTHYNFHRDYKPNLGRYVQSDPIGLEGGVNFFTYVNQSPIILIDAHGQNAIAINCMRNPAACYGLIVAALGVVVHGCKVAVVETRRLIYSWGASDQGLTAEQIDQKNAERMAYKMVCDAKAPEDMDKCAQARWMINNLTKCFNMRQAWDQKWGV